DIEIKVEDYQTKESGLFVEPDFFELFPYHFLEGNGALSQDGIILSEDFSRQLFGNENPLGKIIALVDGEADHLYTVEGVVDISKVKSHLNAPFWAAHVEKEISPHWLFVDTYNYIKVQEGTTPAMIQSAVDKLIEINLFPNMGTKTPFEEWLQRDDAFRLLVQPLADIHLGETLRFDLAEGGNATMVYILLLVAVGILFIAAVNFINLSTARAVKRGKEVGIKKVIGSSRLQLALQFLSESVMICLMAMILALGLSELIILLVERWVGVGVLASVFNNPTELLLAIGLSVLLGILSGLYPALVLSSFRPIQVLKSNLTGQSQSSFRNSLVVVQFTISTILVVGTIIVFQQIQFAQSKDVGFDRENILVVDNANLLDNNIVPFKEALKSQPGVANVSRMHREPGSTNAFSIQSIWSSYVNEPVTSNRFEGDFDYAETMGFKLVAGRYFDASVASDSSAVLLNEAAAKALLLEKPIGEVLNKKYNVIGVVSDFNFETLRKPITPSIIKFSPSGPKLVIRLNARSTDKIIPFIEAQWKQYAVAEPLAYHFVDENFNNLMEQERVMGEVLALFAGLAIFIACLGLYGLSAYLAIQRTKEIGIRKVLGASSESVLHLLSQQYIKLLLLSFLIAAPASVYSMRTWLSEFAYRIDITWWMVTVPCLGIMLIALCTVSYHTLKSSRINPAETLRSE
ncbi:MAG TPA: hypothetical protein DIW27_07295, partial [Cytophagales bacterium]|nr:hypothetical protein [Cytophagales bacterium]